MIGKICDECNERDTCKDYQESLNDPDKILFGCSWEEDDGTE